MKNPLEADKRQRTQRIASEEILRIAQDDKQYVILNEVKNLKVCETVESSTNLEILRFTQDDRVWRERLPRRACPPRNDGEGAS